MVKTSVELELEALRSQKVTKAVLTDETNASGQAPSVEDANSKNQDKADDGATARMLPTDQPTPLERNLFSVPTRKSINSNKGASPANFSMSFSALDTKFDLPNNSKKTGTPASMSMSFSALDTKFDVAPASANKTPSPAPWQPKLKKVENKVKDFTDSGDEQSAPAAAEVKAPASTGKQKVEVTPKPIASVVGPPLLKKVETKLPDFPPKVAADSTTDTPSETLQPQESAQVETDVVPVVAAEAKPEISTPAEVVNKVEVELEKNDVPSSSATDPIIKEAPAPEQPAPVATTSEHGTKVATQLPNVGKKPDDTAPAAVSAPPKRNMMSWGNRSLKNFSAKERDEVVPAGTKTEPEPVSAAPTQALKKVGPRVLSQPAKTANPAGDSQAEVTAKTDATVTSVAPKRGIMPWASKSMKGFKTKETAEETQVQPVAAPVKAFKVGQGTNKTAKPNDLKTNSDDTSGSVPPKRSILPWGNRSLRTIETKETGDVVPSNSAGSSDNNKQAPSPWATAALKKVDNKVKDFPTGGTEDPSPSSEQLSKPQKDQEASAPSAGDSQRPENPVEVNTEVILSGTEAEPVSAAPTNAYVSSEQAETSYKQVQVAIKPKEVTTNSNDAVPPKRGILPWASKSLKSFKSKETSVEAQAPQTGSVSATPPRTVGQGPSKSTKPNDVTTKSDNTTASVPPKRSIMPWGNRSLRTLETKEVTEVVPSSSAVSSDNNKQAPSPWANRALKKVENKVKDFHSEGFEPPASSSQELSPPRIAPKKDAEPKNSSVPSTSGVSTPANKAAPSPWATAALKKVENKVKDFAPEGTEGASSSMSQKDVQEVSGRPASEREAAAGASVPILNKVEPKKDASSTSGTKPAASPWATTGLKKVENKVKDFLSEGTEDATPSSQQLPTPQKDVQGASKVTPSGGEKEAVAGTTVPTLQKVETKKDAPGTPSNKQAASPWATAGLKKVENKVKDFPSEGAENPTPSTQQPSLKQKDEPTTGTVRTEVEPKKSFTPVASAAASTAPQAPSPWATAALKKVETKVKDFPSEAGEVPSQEVGVAPSASESEKVVGTPTRTRYDVDSKKNTTPLPAAGSSASNKQAPSPWANTALKKRSEVPPTSETEPVTNAATEVESKKNTVSVSAASTPSNKPAPSPWATAALKKVENKVKDFPSEGEEPSKSSSQPQQQPSLKQSDTAKEPEFAAKALKKVDPAESAASTSGNAPQASPWANQTLKKVAVQEDPAPDTSA